MPDKSGHKLGVAAQKGLKKEENLDLVQLTNGHKLEVAGNEGDLSRGVPLYYYTEFFYTAPISKAIQGATTLAVVLTGTHTYILTNSHTCIHPSVQLHSYD